MPAMDVRPNSDEARDIAYHFHSYTNAEAHEKIGPLIIESGEGIHVTESNGYRYIAVSYTHLTLPTILLV